MIKYIIRPRESKDVEVRISLLGIAAPDLEPEGKGGGGVPDIYWYNGCSDQSWSSILASYFECARMAQNRKLDGTIPTSARRTREEKKQPCELIG